MSRPVKRALFARLLAVLALGFAVSACVPVPSSLQLAGWVADGFSYLATDKSIVDNGISAASGQDCALYRVVMGRKACQNHDGDDLGLDETLAFKADAPSWADAPVCDMDNISTALPKGDDAVYACAQRLINRFGDVGALNHSEHHIVHYVEQDDMNTAGVWIGIQAAVRHTLEAARTQAIEAEISATIPQES